MILDHLLQGLSVFLSGSARRLSVGGVACHSKRVQPGDLFVALKGPVCDGATHIPEAIRRGARVVVTEADFPAGPEVMKLLVPDAREALACIAARFYGEPAKEMALIGVTGTNGKTTVSYLVEALLKRAGFRVGLIGTVAYRFGERKIPSQNTTPGALDLHFLLSQMQRAGCTYGVMEVSSHALDQKRTDGIPFKTAVFTNLTQDHLDYHRTMETYFQTKCRLFASLDRRATALLNSDSPYAERIREATAARCLTYGLHRKSDVSVRPGSLRQTDEGLSFSCLTPWGTFPVQTPLLGVHNAYNLLAAIGAGLAEKIPVGTLQAGLAESAGVPGRLERIAAGQPFHLFVDYAHTEDALRTVLTSLRTLTSGRLRVLFGCGGDRDRTKRPRMATVAAQCADWAVVTSDNPRTEDPEAILKDVETGFPSGFPYLLECDRARAIEAIIFSAEPGDTVLLAGKGHEAYQVFRDRTVPFDDRQIAYDVLSRSRDSQGHRRIFAAGRP